MNDAQRHNVFGQDRIGSRSIDELIGVARGLIADGQLNDLEIEFLSGWLANHRAISDQPLIRTLFERVAICLEDGRIDVDERADLVNVLRDFSAGDMELGEALKATSLPLCDPPPDVDFDGRSFCFTGTFNFGTRKHCEDAVLAKGGQAGSLKRTTDYLVIGCYATESWKHSSFGHKIVRAAELRDEGHPVAIISEAHWTGYL